ncbi:hypothetical protein EW146_g872 [Bondarzewia mesenterica]|uniref:DUF6593 domain-containing protein n=1 Tax=Bondarzewia mesenterica TaxID=1095465 RepID=A0A4S4M7U2_9AGAM|nr:hypothetical protein EW146_g872 [Bondarzewia mesenterica]
MVFTTNSLRNTTIAVDDDAIYYEVVTRFWHPNLTKIFKLDKDRRELALIAEIERLPGQESKVRFGGAQERWMSEDEFLKWDAVKRGGTFTGEEGVEYRWKSHRRHLQLVRADDEQKASLADFHKHRRHFFVFRMSRHAFLEVKSEATEAMDRLINRSASKALIVRFRPPNDPAHRRGRQTYAQTYSFLYMSACRTLESSKASGQPRAPSPAPKKECPCPYLADASISLHFFASIIKPRSRALDIKLAIFSFPFSENNNFISILRGPAASFSARRDTQECNSQGKPHSFLLQRGRGCDDGPEISYKLSYPSVRLDIMRTSICLSLLAAFCALVSAVPNAANEGYGVQARRPAPSKRADAARPLPSKRAPMKRDVEGRAAHPQPSKRAPAPAPSKRAYAPQPSKRAYAPQPSKRAPVPQPSKHAPRAEPQPYERAYAAQPSKRAYAAQPSKRAYAAQPSKRAAVPQPLDHELSKRSQEERSESEEVVFDTVSDQLCPAELSVCAINPAETASSLEDLVHHGFECVDFKSDLESCGGCGYRDADAPIDVDVGTIAWRFLMRPPSLASLVVVRSTTARLATRSLRMATLVSRSKHEEESIFRLGSRPPSH